MPPISAAFPVKPDGPRANCSKPELLPLVDAAHARPGGPAAQEMKATVCPGCPIGTACLAWAMLWREDGIWGGVSPKTRTMRGAPGANELRAHQRRRSA
jgi:hypothetical protein